MKRIVTACILAVCALLCGCEVKSATADFFAMDTYMSVTAYGKNAKEAVERTERRITELGTMLSVTNPDSEVFYHNSGGELWSKDSAEIMLAASHVSEMTSGAFDIHIYPVVEAWGFFSRDYRVPGEEELRELLENRDMLDFGGIAKGYASDLAAEIMRGQGIDSALIALGGNIYAVGKSPEGIPWRIAVQSPFDEGAFSGVLNITDEAAVTSGAYQRRFEQDGETYHHIIDPKTGYPADSGLSSVTVVSHNGTLADGLSTGLFVLGKERALEVWRSNKELFELVLIEDDGSITVTSGLENRFESEYTFDIAQ